MATIYKGDSILSKLEDYFGNWFTKTDLPFFSNKLYPYKNLFTAIKINDCEIKNRIIMGAMSNINMVDVYGGPTNKLIEYFTARAKGGVGLIVTGMVPTTYGIDPTLSTQNYPRIDNIKSFAKWQILTEKTHSFNTKIFIQLSAGLGRLGAVQNAISSLKLPVSASINPNIYASAVPCVALSDNKIKKIIHNTGLCAKNALKCGFDGICLHGHEGYLIEQLSNSAFNRRILGKYTNPMQFGIDLVSEIRKICGEHYPIVYKIDLSLALNSTYGEKLNKINALKKFKKERSVKQTLLYMEQLVKAGVDAFDIDLGCYENWWLPHPPASMPSGCFINIAEVVKKHFEKNNILTSLGKPVVIIAVGKLGYPDLAENVLDTNKADMIMLSRPLLADANWVNKTYCNNIENIIPCIGCNKCLTNIMNHGSLMCSVNATTGNEYLNKNQKSKQK